MTFLVVGIFCMLKGFWVVVGGGKNIGLRAMDVGTFAYGTVTKPRDTKCFLARVF